MDYQKRTSVVCHGENVIKCIIRRRSVGEDDYQEDIDEELHNEIYMFDSLMRIDNHFGMHWFEIAYDKKTKKFRVRSSDNDYYHPHGDVKDIIVNEFCSEKIPIGTIFYFNYSFNKSEDDIWSDIPEETKYVIDALKFDLRPWNQY